uniref:Putative secreted protein n=1 Tax=Ixodes ricinus TaxID=34613 RepID=A0A6B0UD97_IXORI
MSWRKRCTKGSCLWSSCISSSLVWATPSDFCGSSRYSKAGTTKATLSVLEMDLVERRKCLWKSGDGWKSASARKRCSQLVWRIARLRSALMG